MLTTKEFNENYWKMFDAGIIEDDRKTDEIQISIEEIDGSQIFKHFFEVANLEDAKNKIIWLLNNTNCYDVVLWRPGRKPITWYHVDSAVWEWYSR